MKQVHLCYLCGQIFPYKSDMELLEIVISNTEVIYKYICSNCFKANKNKIGEREKNKVDGIKYERGNING